MLRKFKVKLNKLLYGSDTAVIEFNNRTDNVEGMSYLICRAIVPDIPEILAIERSVYAGKMPWDFDNFKNEINKRRSTLYLVARYNDELVAFAGIDFRRTNNIAHITNVAVAPNHQKKGLGRKLLKVMIEKAYEQKCKGIALEVREKNENAKKLYRDLGFKILSSKQNYYTDENEDALVMSLSFENAKER